MGQGSAEGTRYRCSAKLSNPAKQPHPPPWHPRTPPAFQIPLSSTTDAAPPPPPAAAHHVIDPGPLRVGQQGDESRQKLRNIIPVCGGEEGKGI